MIVRDLSRSDFDQWRELFLAYGEFYETSFSEEIVSGVFRDLLDETHPETCFVANEKGVLVGFAHVQRQYDTFRSGTGWFLDDLFVHPDYRGAGIARALISQVSSFAASNGGGDLRWITAASNDTAQRLYDQIATRTQWVVFEMPTSRELS
jgi:GNAT superfamily N-acetyltransferase